jgi:hypothetical protein
MKTLLPISKQLGGFLLVLGVMFVLVTFIHTHAASTVSYPITSLGNCSSKASCETYCSTSSHQSVCSSYAQIIGLSTAASIPNSTTILTLAQKALTCTSLASCKTYCDTPSNYTACEDFALNNNMNIPSSPTFTTLTSQLVTEAKSYLGCDSAMSCANFCGQQSNFAKCAVYAETYGLTKKTSSQKQTMVEICTTKDACTTLCKPAPLKCPGMDLNNIPSQFSIPVLLPANIPDNIPTIVSSHTGPGGCVIGPACVAYCSEHESICQQYFEAEVQNIAIPSSLANVSVTNGPNGCTTVSACEQYCLENPSICAQYNPSPSTTPTPTGVYASGPTTPTPSTSNAIPSGLPPYLQSLLQLYEKGTPTP